MAISVSALEAEALKLPPEERALLADHLLASLSGEPEIEDAWAIEVEHRIAEIESGQVALVPAEQAVKRARQALS